MPTIGRWLTPDPLGFADGPNLYTFVHNQPFAYIDPDGQFAFLIPLAVSLALSYCAPPAAVFLAECTGCVAAASFVTGLADGYNWSCPDTSYCVDPTSSWAKCAGVAIGGALSLVDVPRKGLTKAVTYAAASPIAAGMAAKAGSTVAHACSSYSRTAATQTTLKTAEVAERYVVKNGVQYTKSNLQLGQKMHNSYKSGLNNGGKEFRLPSGRRIDYLDINNATIYELKPFNPRAMQQGQRQLQLYKQELETMPRFKDINWNTILETY